MRRWKARLSTRPARFPTAGSRDTWGGIDYEDPCEGQGASSPYCASLCDTVNFVGVIVLLLWTMLFPGVLISSAIRICLPCKACCKRSQIKEETRAVIALGTVTANPME